jgi:hypothetical protein
MQVLSSSISRRVKRTAGAPVGTVGFPDAR